MSVNIGSGNIGGQDVAFEADARTERFYVTLDGNILGQGDTMEKAKRAAATAIRKRRVKVEVPFALQDGRRGIADGIHLKNRSVLSSIDGAREDLGYNPKALSADIPDDKLARIGEIDEATRTLQRERGEIVRAYELDLVKAVKSAIQNEIDEEDKDEASKTGAAAHG